MKSAVTFAIALFTIINSVHAHICIIEPHQRGAMNIQDAGDPTCFRKKPPCGGLAAGTPAQAWVGGSTTKISWQQNYNHYEPGFPGFMDIAYSTNPNASSDSDFQTLLVVPDFNAHAQSNQQNFTATITVPNINCPQCVIRMRYAPNKPTEDIFYQCADVSITQSNPVSTPVYAVQYPASQSGSPSLFVAISSNGAPSVLSEFNFDVHKRSVGYPFITDQVGDRDSSTGLIYYTASSSGIVGSVPDTLVTVNSKTYAVSYVQLQINGNPLVAINVDSASSTVYGLQLAHATGYYWQYVLSQVNTATGSLTPIVTLPRDDTYVNFQWSDIDTVNKKIFLLTGNENDADGLTAQIYTIDIPSATYKVVNVDVHAYTIAGIHYDSVKKVLWALSPGLTSDTSVQWSLVSVNPSTGSVTSRFPVGSKDQYAPYYGGDVYGGFNPTTRTLLYSFYTQSSGQGRLAIINVDTGIITWQFITDLNTLHNIVSFA